MIQYVINANSKLYITSESFIAQNKCTFYFCDEYERYVMNVSWCSLLENATQISEGSEVILSNVIACRKRYLRHKSIEMWFVSGY